MENGTKVITVSLDTVKSKGTAARAFFGTDSDEVFEAASAWIESKLGAWYPGQLDNGAYRIWLDENTAAGFMTIATETEEV